MLGQLDNNLEKFKLSVPQNLKLIKVDQIHRDLTRIFKIHWEKYRLNAPRSGPKSGLQLDTRTKESKTNRTTEKFIHGNIYVYMFI